MRFRHARALALMLMLTPAAAAAVHAQQPLPTKAALQEASNVTLGNAARYLESWTSEQRVQIVFVIVIAVLGILVAALQKPKTPLARQASIGLAITISILTSLNQTLFKIDYHTLARKKQTVATAADRIRNALSFYQDDWPEADRRKMADEIEQRVNVIRDTADEVNPQLIWVLGPLDFTTTAYAQAAEPSWLSSPPPDGDSLFAVGQGTAPTLTEASRKAMDAAAQQLAAKAARRWQRTSQSAPVVSPDFARYVAAKMTTVDSHIGRDERGGGLHYEVLVKIAVALVGEKSYVVFAQSPVQAAAPAASGPPVVVEPEIRLRQSRKVMLTSTEFGGSVSLYSGEPRSGSSGGASRLVVFRTGAEAQRWRDGDRIDYDALRRTLAPNQILLDTEVRQGAKVSYLLGGRRYIVEITRVEGAGSSQSIVARVLRG
jgi:hypothetical protein